MENLAARSVVYLFLLLPYTETKELTISFSWTLQHGRGTKGDFFVKNLLFYFIINFIFHRSRDVRMYVWKLILVALIPFHK